MSTLEREKHVIAEELEKPLPKTTTAVEMFEHAFRFLSNPWNIWEKGDLTLGLLVLRLGFAEPNSYGPDKGVRAPKTTLSFNMLAGICGENEAMAHLGGESSNTLFDILAQWNQVLKSIDLPANDPEEDVCREVS